MKVASFEEKGVWIDARNDRRPMTDDRIIILWNPERAMKMERYKDTFFTKKRAMTGCYRGDDAEWWDLFVDAWMPFPDASDFVVGERSEDGEA